MEPYSCQCYCVNHQDCRCSYNWCSCIIEDKQRKRKRCHCRRSLRTDTMASLSGYFIGQFCYKCGLYSRISEFYNEHHNVIKVFLNKEDSLTSKEKKASVGAMAFQDDQGIYCVTCVKIVYRDDVPWAVKAEILIPIFADENDKACSICDKIGKEVYTS